jgi:myo-inositol-1(or 4)-monophosphatase
MLATGFSYGRARRGRQAAVLVDLLPRVRDIRRMGAASVDLCSVACGRVDAYFETDLNHWDVAAGLLIAEEAGATVGGIGGGPAGPESVLAATPDVFEALRTMLQRAGATDPP